MKGLVIIIQKHKYILLSTLISTFFCGELSAKNLQKFSEEKVSKELSFFTIVEENSIYIDEVEKMIVDDMKDIESIVTRDFQEIKDPELVEDEVLITEQKVVYTKPKKIFAYESFSITKLLKLYKADIASGDEFSKKKKSKLVQEIKKRFIKLDQKLYDRISIQNTLDKIERGKTDKYETLEIVNSMIMEIK